MSPNMLLNGLLMAYMCKIVDLSQTVFVWSANEPFKRTNTLTQHETKNFFEKKPSKLEKRDLNLEKNNLTTLMYILKSFC